MTLVLEPVSVILLDFFFFFFFLTPEDQESFEGDELVTLLELHGRESAQEFSSFCKDVGSSILDGDINSCY
ncbi:MAG: hypothetical protein EZS28_006686 [Streblomastix strix]|uniref:Uncharacterized protein n=1 Tax=Streblomastix strix TaxID=222440 RepID=A0A5J4WSK8_9EUKA|nr:MAG: hypothetical protein EZS28_006686 [Streblomastix strix]